MRGVLGILASLSTVVLRQDAGAQTNQTSLPFYPSPWTTGAGDWAEAYQKARDFVSQLTLLEKVNLTTGIG
jgi:beta-glucosidase